MRDLEWRVVCVANISVEGERETEDLSAGSTDVKCNDDDKGRLEGERDGEGDGGYTRELGRTKGAGVT